jgi:hypothetical protein
MQSKELLRNKLISLQCRCVDRKKHRFWTAEDVVDVSTSVDNVTNVAFHRILSFFDGSLKKVGQPCWKVGKKQKQNGLATFCGKIAPSYINRIIDTQLSSTDSKVVKRGVFVQNKTRIEKSIIIEENFAKKLKGERIKVSEGREFSQVYCNFIEWLYVLSIKRGNGFIENLVKSLRGECKNKNDSVQSYIRVNAVNLFYFLFLMLTPCRHLWWLTIDDCWVRHGRQQPDFHVLSRHWSQLRPRWHWRQLRPCWHWSQLRPRWQCKACKDLSLATKQNEHVQKTGRQETATQEMYSTQVTFISILSYEHISTVACEIVCKPIFNNFTIFFAILTVCNNSMCARTKQASETGACENLSSPLV